MKTILKALIKTAVYENRFRTFREKNLIMWLPYPWIYFKEALLVEKLKAKHL